ncbi:phospholipase A [Rheinheimera sp.]|uniref:phospholipase A n=1 Tax=Rheinheimera sp. TaxID=1869214 RepID=UPI00307D3973
MKRITLGMMAVCYAATAQAQEVAVCRTTADNTQRLACYDRIFGVTSPVSDGTALPDEVAATPAKSVKLATIMEKYWELTPKEKRDRFVFRTYLPNFFLPLHYSSSINREPRSPSRGGAPRNDNYKPVESKLQLSLRAKLMSNLLFDNADLWFAYTQVSMWQLWNQQDSAPFRNTDYQPELLYVVPVKDEWGDLPGDWELQMLQFGIAHQSNGQSDPLSRSWNRLYAAVAMDHGDFGLRWRYHQRLSENVKDDDNPDLIDYTGSHEISATWLPGLATAQLTWRNDLGYLSRGSWMLDLTYPVDKTKLDGLRWHLQLFSGYGETLLDYNHRQNSLGLGVMLFNF